MSQIVAGRLVPLKFEQIALTGTPATLNPPSDARIAAIDAEIQNVRYRVDGGAPTTTVGMRILADTGLSLTANLSAIQLVAETAGAVINVTYYR